MSACVNLIEVYSQAWESWPGICGTQVKSSSNKHWMSHQEARMELILVKRLRVGT